MMETTIPAEHQALGRKAKGFNRAVWDKSAFLFCFAVVVWLYFVLTCATANKSRIVEEGNYHKFTKSKTGPGMLKALLDTGDRELVEVSAHPPAAPTRHALTAIICRLHRQTGYGASGSARRMLKRIANSGVRTV